MTRSPIADLYIQFGDYRVPLAAVVHVRRVLSGVATEIQGAEPTRRRCRAVSDRRRQWTEAEDQILRDQYGKCPLAEIAELTHRTKSSVYNRAANLGLVTKHQWATDEQIISALHDLHPQGLSDAELIGRIIERTGCEAVNRHRIGTLRRKLGLPNNRFAEHQRQRVRDKTREQLDAAGLPTLAHLRNAKWSQWKCDLGWPENLTVRAVQSLEMFYRHGPLTRIQLCKLLGVSSKKRTAPISNVPGGTVLAELTRAGLISSCVKAVRGHGKGKSVNLYFLNPGVEPIHEQRQRSATVGGCESATG